MSEFYYNIRTEVPDSIPVLFALPALLMIIIYFFNLKEKYTRIVIIAQVAGLLFVCWYGFKTWANFNAEVTMTYDHLVRNERWDGVLKYAEKKPPRNYMSLAMLNLSLAKTGQLGNRMFHYDQHGINGLFLPFNREYVAPLMGNEVFYHLGLINASQEYVFESMETIPNLGKSVRAVKRLAETNLINGHYRVSEKYLKLLENTMFYRRWAKETRNLLDNEDMINSHPDYGEKRKFMVRNDYFFHVKNIEAVLNRLVKENPGNRMAFEYLMAFYMINKDLRNFINCMPMTDKMNYREIPVSYQEAMMYIIGLRTSDPMAKAQLNISESTKARMRAYADIYTNYPDAQERLRKNFSGTYWYYLHFKELENNPDE